MFATAIQLLKKFAIECISKIASDGTSPVILERPNSFFYERILIVQENCGRAGKRNRFYRDSTLTDCTERAPTPVAPNAVLRKYKCKKVFP